MAFRRDPILRSGLFAAALLVAACQADDAPVTGADSFDPGREARLQADCVAEGGRWGRGGAGGALCYRDTPDANRPCDSADDCTGLCLARSGTCAPVTPFLGCHEILTAAGARATLCVE